MIERIKERKNSEKEGKGRCQKSEEKRIGRREQQKGKWSEMKAFF